MSEHHDLDDRFGAPPPATSTRFPGADTLRAVGALCVLTTHVAFWSGDYADNGTYGTLLGRLDVGVAVFFVLSGFLLARPWVTRAAEGRPGPDVPSYFWKRLLRIAPLYVVTVVIALAFLSGNRDRGPGDWATTLLMADTFVHTGLPAGLTHMWSLAVEVTFYLLLPLIMLGLLGRDRPLSVRRYGVGLVLLSGVSLWWILDGVSRVAGTVEAMPAQWLPSYLLWFVGGLLLCLLQVLHERGEDGPVTRALSRVAKQPGACWVVVLGLMLLTATPLAGPTMLDVATPAETLTKQVIYGLVGFLLVLTVVFPATDGVYARLAGHPLGRRLGWISYGLFCLHLPVLHLVMWATGWQLFAGRGPAIWVLTVVVSVAVAELAYRVVERPALRLKGRSPFRRPAAPQPTSTAASEAHAE